MSDKIKAKRNRTKSKKIIPKEFTVAELKDIHNSEQNQRLSLFAKKAADRKEALKLEEVKKYNSGELYI